MYGIEIIGYGKRRRYCVKELVRNGLNPTDGRAYRTEEAARDAAGRMGVEIVAVGDLWELLAAAERSV